MREGSFWWRIKCGEIYSSQPHHSAFCPFFSPAVRAVKSNSQLFSLYSFYLFFSSCRWSQVFDVDHSALPFFSPAVRANKSNSQPSFRCVFFYLFFSATACGVNFWHGFVCDNFSDLITFLQIFPVSGANQISAQIPRPKNVKGRFSDPGQRSPLISLLLAASSSPNWPHFPNN